MSEAARPAPEQGAPTGDDSGFTADLAAFASGLAFEELEQDAIAMARLAVLDLLGVALAGSREPLPSVLREQTRQDGGNPAAVMIGGSRASAPQAAFVNGVAAHVLDYDDVNMAIPGHPSVVILPALLAAAALTPSRSGRDFLAAFVAGYETACRIGAAMGEQHYEAGFHSTATIGRFGAAAACGRFFGLTPGEMRHALGIAGTSSAGLKCVFGTDSKPLHAGLAARDGLEAARAARLGIGSNPSILECAGGFAAAHGSPLSPQDTGRPYILDNLFKHHASCYNTHAPIEAALQLRKRLGEAAAQAISVAVTVASGVDAVCNIQFPRTGNEGKFSIRFTVAAALLGLDTSDPATFTAAIVQSEKIVALIPRIVVDLQPSLSSTFARVALTAPWGEEFSASHDAGAPAEPDGELARRLEDKMMVLSDPIVGQNTTADLCRAIHNLDRLEHLDTLLNLLSTG